MVFLTMELALPPYLFSNTNPWKNTCNELGVGSVGCGVFGGLSSVLYRSLSWSFVVFGNGDRCWKLRGTRLRSSGPWSGRWKVYTCKDRTDSLVAWIETPLPISEIIFCKIELSTRGYLGSLMASLTMRATPIICTKWRVCDNIMTLFQNIHTSILYSENRPSILSCSVQKIALSEWVLVCGGCCCWPHPDYFPIELAFAM